MTPDVSAAPSIRPAQQQRSRDTLRRIVDALAELLDEQTFEDVSVQQICEKAGASVGAFYARVGKKDALLEHLRQKVYAETEAQIAELFAPEAWRDVALSEMLTRHAQAWVAVHRARRGVHRALIVEARRNTAFAEHARAFNDRLLAAVVRAWLEKRDEIRHERPKQAVRHAFMMATSFARESIVFSDMWPGYRPRSDRELARELALLLRGYLT